MGRATVPAPRRTKMEFGRIRPRMARGLGAGKAAAEEDGTARINDNLIALNTSLHDAMMKEERRKKKAAADSQLYRLGSEAHERWLERAAQEKVDTARGAAAVRCVLLGICSPPVRFPRAWSI